VLIVGFLLVSSVLWLTRTRSGDQVAPPPEAEEGPAMLSVAVLPFNVSGTGFEYLSEGMIELVSANLEGMTGVRPVSPSTVIARWSEHVPA
jgi:hypothetical protein